MQIHAVMRWLAIGGAATLALGVGPAAFSEPTGLSYVPSPLSAESADMWQANRVVWAMEHSNGVVFAGGSFTSVRPPGSPAGQNEVPQARLAAFDSATGTFIRGWRPVVNGEVDTIDVSPDGSRLYVGGAFTRVDNQVRNRIAAFDISNPTAPVLLRTDQFDARLNARVYDIESTSASVFVAGRFTSANGQRRTLVASFAADGALHPFEVGLTGTTDPEVVKPWATSVSLAGGRAYVGGQFLNLDGARTEGLAVVHDTTGDPVTGFAYPDRADGQGGWVTDTLTYAGNLYLEGRVPPARAGTRLEGIEALNPTTGAVLWGGDGHRCLGDSFNLLGLNGIVWVATHAHDCGQIGAYPEQNPRFSWHATVLGQDAATGEQVAFYPQVSGRAGVPGSLNNSRALTTDGRNLFVGGGFLNVLGEGAQQNLVKFAVKADGGDAPARPSRPTVTSAGGDATVTWSAVMDRDDRDLTYQVLRRGSNTPVASIPADSPWWAPPTLRFTDTGVSAGESVYYRVRVTDGSNVQTSLASLTVTVG